MRILLPAVLILVTSSSAFAQPAKSPEELLPGDATVYFRYDGYEPHKKAYDQTALAKVMREGLGDFFTHVWTQMWNLASEEFPPPKGKKPDARSRQAAERFLDSIWRHGFAATLEVAPLRKGHLHEEMLQLTVVFPRGAQAKERKSLEEAFRLAAKAADANIEPIKEAGRTGHGVALGGIHAAWWAEGEHLLLSLGGRTPAAMMRALDARKTSVADATWFKELAAAQPYETDVRGYVDLATLVDRAAMLGLEPPGLMNFKDHLARQVVVRHLGLYDLKALTFHLGFDGKFQRSTVRVGVVEPDKRAGLMRLVTGPITFDPAKLPPMAPDTDYVSVRHVDWDAIFEYIRTTHGMLVVADAFSGKIPVKRFPDFDQIVGMDFRKDFLAQLETTVVTWGAHSEGPFFLGQAFAVKVKDADKVRKGLAAIRKALGDDEMFAVEVRKFRGNDLHVFSRLALPVTYTMHDGWLVVGLFPQPVQGFLMRSGGKYRTWKAPPELAIAMEKERKQNGKGKLLGVSVSDPRPAIEIGLSLLPPFMQMINQGAGAEVLKVNEIPIAQSINEWLFPNITLCYDDGNALRFEHHYSINEPDDLLLGSLVPGLGMVFPAVPLRWNAPKAPFEKGFPAPKGDPVFPKFDANEPVRGTASAFERDGDIVLEVTLTKQFPVTEVRKVPYMETRTELVGGKPKVVTETKFKDVVETVYRPIEETRTLRVMPGKVAVTRKDGTSVPGKDLPMLLKKTPVVVIESSTMKPEALRDVDEKTLIIQIVPREPEFLPDPKKLPRVIDPSK